MREEKKKNLKRWIKVIISIVIAVTCGLLIELFIQVEGNKRTAEKTSEMLLNQIVGIIEKNEQDEEVVLEALKEDYIIRAKAVAYIIDQKASRNISVEEFNKIAKLMSVDEIHLFDKTGAIYNGSVPEYYGYSFDSGEQMGYFKPMLKHKALSMCQDITPNTAEGKSMMYAITWNESGTRMVQIGVEPTRLLQQYKRNEINKVVDSMPMYEGYEICIADAADTVIYGATDYSKIGKTLGQIGITVPNQDISSMYQSSDWVEGEKTYSTIQSCGDYIIIVNFQAMTFKNDIIISLGLVLIYILIASVIIVLMLSKLFKSNSVRDEQLSVLRSMSDIYYSVHLINLMDNTSVQYAARDTVEEVVQNSSNDAKKTIHDVMKATLTEGYMEEGLDFTDLGTLPERMRDKKIISMDLLGKHVGWIRMSFISIESGIHGVPTKVICTTQIIDAQKRKEETLIMQSNADGLTKCLNRRAYEDDIENYPDIPTEDNFVYVSFDVNGLKVVNDTLGHAAGDEMLRGAAECILQCFGNYGRVYRTGGDEFVAIIFANRDRLAEIKVDFENVTMHWKGELVDELAISAGYVTKKEFPTETVREIAIIADERMYSQKSAFYLNKGVDRRGQQAAHEALCERYNKILKINITKDTFHIITMDIDEQTREKGFSDRISEWLSEFGKSGQVHEDDLPTYLEKTNIAFLRQYFKGEKKDLGIFYRRKVGDVFMQAAMEIIPANDYSDDDQNLFLYVRTMEG